MVLTISFARFQAIELSCHRHPADMAHRSHDGAQRNPRGVLSGSRSRMARRSPQRGRQRGTPWSEKRIDPMQCEADVGSRG
jgi:hypothetical protein